MRTEEKSNIKNSIYRLVFAALALIIQIVWIVIVFMKLYRYSTWINMFFGIVTLSLVLHIYGKQQNAAFKMPWMILLLISPVLGICIYGMFGQKNATRKKRIRFEKLEKRLSEYIHQQENVLHNLEEEDILYANQSRYISKYAGYPLYQNTDVVFYAEASEGFEAQLVEISKAEHFIFMEYHAIQEAESFARLKAILAERASHGVEVRVFYDDVGSVGFLDFSFIKRMEAIGVQCRVFNPVHPIFNMFMNNRDHRKITVIDGKVGFTGGYNLADEYFNITHPYGHWKDTGVKLTGSAVSSLTAMFLEMWNAMDETDLSFERYFPKVNYQAFETSGFVQPYADSPLDGESVGENVYLNLIKNARHYFYAATPYLIIGDEMARELCMAAQRGVDVRIITPGIPDKKVIYKITRSYYGGLVAKGIRIYEYSPGFIHQKQTLCDGIAATVGTINMDYRSLYHHFENGVFLYKCNAIDDILKDFQAIFETSCEVTEAYKGKRKAVLRLGQCILRLFAPLL